MNFQAVEQANGNNVAMFGIITEFCGEGVNPNSGKPWKKVKLADDNGTTHNVTLRGTLPPVTLQGQRAQFSLGTFQGSYEGQPYTGYSGFWNSQTAPQQGSRQPPQAPPQQARQPNPKKEPDWDAKDLRMARECALKSATSLVCTLAELTEKSIGLDAIRIKAVAELFVDYIYNGNRVIPDPDPSIQEPQYSGGAPTGDDIPF
jgi:hypothetical protein